jgi:hypothetical protein
MILHGIEVTKFKWNDKEVTEEEYIQLNEEWKKSVESLEEPEPKKKKK